jgi:hypothetical protein
MNKKMYSRASVKGSLKDIFAVVKSVFGIGESGCPRYAGVILSSFMIPEKTGNW